MPKIKTGRQVKFGTGENYYHCTKCRKDFKGYSRAIRHHERTGHDGFVRKFLMHILIPKAK